MIYRVSERWRYVAIVGLLLCTPLAHGHDARPLYIELTAMSANQYQLAWKMPDSVPLANIPKFTLAPGCVPLNLQRTGSLQWLRCAETPQSLSWQFPQDIPPLTTLLRWRSPAGAEHSLVLAPGNTQALLPTTPSASRVLAQYVYLGATHIWRGADHLLFLLCLLWLATTPRRLIWAITGFTLGHCTTLALATVGTIRVAVAPAEVCIALSIAWLAAELLRRQQNPTVQPPSTLTFRSPGLVALGFGLLHGLGFASVLAEIGLPQERVPSALLGFNIGVELGQLAFVALVITLVSLAKRSRAVQQLASATQRLTLYLIGSTALFWAMQRLWLF